MPLTKPSPFSHDTADTKVLHSRISPPLRHTRPKFDTHNTSDRLSEGLKLQTSPFSMIGNIKKGRKSIFREVGLVDVDHGSDDGSRPAQARDASTSSEVDFGEVTGLSDETRRQHLGDNDRHSSEVDDDQEGDDENVPDARIERRQTIPDNQKAPWYAKLSPAVRRPRVKAASNAPPPAMVSLQRLTMIAVIIAILVPCFNYRSGRSHVDINGADAGVIRKRETSPTEVCLRWAHQVAQLNGTLYIYGGQAKSRGDQETNTWNNYFLTLDLQQSWDVDEPRLEGLERPDGPPEVSLGYLWQDYNSLYLYGGQFADNDGGLQQYATPDEMALWRYNINDEEWSSFRDPETSSGNYSTDSGIPVERAAEGAGLSVPELGLSWYFGGHLDVATTRGWSLQIPRLYLSSLLEWTHPGFGNDAVESLRDSGAGDGGAYRNITEGGNQQDSEDFPERADAVLIFVPGWGERGVLLGLGGGMEDELTENMETLDVFDIDTSEWYNQETTGDSPPNRVNPCAVVASAPDASSFQIYLFGGQDLPFGNQTQYNDMYILTVPAFHWIRVDADDDNVPDPRAGHTCTMRDGQMILVGGYVGEDIECDSPGIYVFNASSLQWTDRFVAGDHEADFSPDNSVLAGSWGYRVPEAVQSVVGGNAEGSATLTTPSGGPATGGPFATGTPPVFTVTATPDAGESGGGGSGGSGGGSGSDSDDGDDGTDPGLIAAGVIAGLFGVLAAYLGFCAWLYRRQVRAYKQHLAVANRYSGASIGAGGSFHRSASLLGGLLGSRSGGEKRGRNGKLLSSAHKHRREPSTASEDSFSWVGAGVEPAWPSDGPSPSSGTGSGATAAAAAGKQSWSASGSGTAAGTGSGPGSGYASGGKQESDNHGRTTGGSGNESKDSDRGSVSSTERLLEGQEPSFFSVVLGPRRALRVVNGIEDNTAGQQVH